MRNVLGWIELGDERRPVTRVEITPRGFAVTATFYREHTLVPSRLYDPSGSLVCESSQLHNAHADEGKRGAVFEFQWEIALHSLMTMDGDISTRSGT